MTKRAGTEDALEQVRELKSAGMSDAGLTALKKFLQHRSNNVVAKACDLVSEWRAESLIPEVESAFHRLLKNPVKSDPGCSAKLSAVKCLAEFEHPYPDLFLEGAHHVQMEPAWGPPVDTAAGLRGASGYGLAVIRYPDAYLEHAALIMDPEPETRRIAIETLSSLASDQSELLLRMKVLATDPEPDILASAFQALMTLSPQRSFDFVSAYVQDEDLPVAEGAALALGESKLPEAFERLREVWDISISETHRQMLALPIALLRSDEAFKLLLPQLESSRQQTAVAVLMALAIYAGDESKATAIAKAIETRGGRELSNIYEQHFGE